jgi:hypothetical protein
MGGGGGVGEGRQEYKSSGEVGDLIVESSEEREGDGKKREEKECFATE